MKIKKYYGILPLLLMTLVACNMEDKGNYDYIDRDDFFPVKIVSTFAADIRDIEFIPQEPVYYEPEFEVMDDYDRYTYTWFATFRGTDGSVQRVEIADTRILDLEHFPLNPGSYTFFYEIKDPVHNLQRLYTIYSVTVAASPIGSNGIYIMKNADGNTEIDYYKFTRATEIPEEMPIYKNIVSSVFDGPLLGKPVGMERYATSYYWEKFDENGSPVTERITVGGWYFLTEEDIVATSVDFTISYKHFEGQFYLQPDAVKPQYVAPLRNYMFYFMNDNQIYGTYAMSSGIGRFGKANRVGGVRVSSAGMLSGSWYSMAYDEISGEFIYPYGMDGSITNATAKITESTLLTNKEVVMDKLVEPIAIMEGGGAIPAGGSYIQGSMILKHKTLPNTFYLTQTKSNGGVPFTWIRPIDSNADIVKTPTPIMSSTYYGNGIYYAKNGNELWYYADGGDTETPSPLADRQTKVLTLGAGETIVKITPVAYHSTVQSQLPYLYAWVTVLVNTNDGRYKLYAFDNKGSTAELETEPALVLEGEGEAVSQYMHFTHQSK